MLRNASRRTQAQIGAVIGVSQTQVSRLIRKAISERRAADDEPEPTPGM